MSLGQTERRSNPLNVTSAAQSHEVCENQTDSDSDDHNQAVSQLLYTSKLFVETFNELCFFCYRTSANIVQALFIELFEGQV